MRVKCVNIIFYKFYPKDLIDIKLKTRRLNIKSAEFMLNLMLSENEFFSDEAIKKIWFSSFRCNVPITNFIKYKLELAKNFQKENLTKPSKMLRLENYDESIALALKEKALKLEMKQVEYNTMKLFFAYKITNLFSNTEINKLKQSALLENKSLKEYITSKILDTKRDIVKEFFTRKELAKILRMSINTINQLASKNGDKTNYLYIEGIPQGRGPNAMLYPVEAVRNKLLQLGNSKEKIEQILLGQE